MPACLVTPQTLLRWHRQRPARRGEERPVAVLQLRAPDGPTEDLDLVAEDGILELELGHAPRPLSTPIPRTSTK